MKAKVLIRPKQGILDPQGRRSSGRCRRSASRGSPTSGWADWSSSRPTIPTRSTRSARSCSPIPLIEDFEVVIDGDGRWSPRQIGVLQFPGSCDERDALAGLRARRRGAAGLARGDRPLGARRDRRPGGFSYGDYLRAGAIARFSPAMEAVAGFAAEAARARDLQRLPGAVRGGAAARRAAAERGPALRLPPGRAGRRGRTTPFTAELEAGQRLSIPIKHMTGRYFAPETSSTELEADGQVAFRYAPGDNPNGTLRDIAGVANEAGNVLGLMPHPEHAVDPLTGSDDGLALFARSPQPRVSAVAASVEALPGAEHRARAHRLRVRADRRAARARAERRRAGDVLAAVVRALRLQALAQAARPAAHRGRAGGDGPGRERRRGRRRRRLAVAFKVESHNHPSAVEPFQGAATGVGGILRDVFAIGARPIAVLDSLRFGELDSERSRYLFDRVGRRDRPLRQLDRGADGRRRGLLRGPLRAQLPGQRDVRRARAPTTMVRSAAAGARQRVVLMGASTGRDGIGGASVLASARARGRRRRQAPQRPDRRPVRGVEAARVLPGAARPRACSSRCRTSARAASPPRRARWPRQGRRRDRHRRRPGAAARGRHGAVRDHGLRVAGADARGGRARQARRGAGALRALADRRRRDRRGDRQRARSGPATARRSATSPSPRWSTSARSTTSSRDEPGAGSTATRRRSAAVARHAGETLTLGRLLALLASPSIASKRWAFEQYDSIVGSRTARRPEAADAAVLHAARGRRAIAVSIDGNGRRVACDPYAARSRRCSSAPRTSPASAPSRSGSPTASTSATREAGRRLAARPRGAGPGRRLPALGVPVVGGNVSLYNETEPGRSTRRRSSAWSASFPTRPRPGFELRGRRRDRAGRPVRALARRLGAGEAARRAPDGLPATGIEPVAAARRSSRERSAAGPSARPRRQRRRPRLRARRDGDRRRGRRSTPTSTGWSSCAGCSGETACSARARGLRARGSRPTREELLRAGGAPADALAIGAAGDGSRSRPRPSAAVSVRSADADAPGGRSAAQRPPPRSPPAGERTAAAAELLPWSSGTTC